MWGFFGDSRPLQSDTTCTNLHTSVDCCGTHRYWGCMYGATPELQQLPRATWSEYFHPLFKSDWLPRVPDTQYVLMQRMNTNSNTQSKLLSIRIEFATECMYTSKQRLHTEWISSSKLFCKEHMNINSVVTREAFNHLNRVRHRVHVCSNQLLHKWIYRRVSSFATNTWISIAIVVTLKLLTIWIGFATEGKLLNNFHTNNYQLCTLSQAM